MLNAGAARFDQGTGARSDVEADIDLTVQAERLGSERSH
jgi:hypothetical protein